MAHLENKKIIHKSNPAICETTSKCSYSEQLAAVPGLYSTHSLSLTKTKFI
jgi:hypothetical protein